MPILPKHAVFLSVAALILLALQVAFSEQTPSSESQVSISRHVPRRAAHPAPAPEAASYL
jgi:hypothetical protein